MSPLPQRVALPIPFAGGVETQQDPKQVPPVRLLDLQNGVFTRKTTISKRNGYSAFSKEIEQTGASYANTRALASRDDAVVVITDENAYTRSAATGKWIDEGPLALATQSQRPVARTGTTQSHADHADQAGVRLVAWEDSRGGVWYQLVDAITGGVLKSTTQADSLGQRPRCCAVGVLLHLYYAVPSSRIIWVIVFDPRNPTASPPAQVLVSDLYAAQPHYDVEPTTRSGTPALIGWFRDPSEGDGFRVGYVHSSGVLGSTLTSLPNVRTSSWVVGQTPNSISVAFDPSRGAFATEVGCVVVGSLGTQFEFYDSSLVITFGPTTSSAPIIRVTSAWARDTQTDAGSGLTFRSLWMVREIAGATNRDNRVEIWRYKVFSGSISLDTAAGGTQRGCGLVSRAFRDGSGVYAMFGHDVAYFTVYLCLLVSTAATAGTVPLRCMARTLSVQATGLPSKATLPCVLPDSADARVHRWAAGYREQLESADSSQFTERGIMIIAYDFDPDGRETAQLGRGLYAAGACPAHYDGDAWTEHGFHYAPDNVAAAVQSTGGSLTALGTYFYRFWYEWTDAAGEIHRGPVSIGTTVTLATGNQTVTLTIPTLRHTAKANVRIGVARSVAGIGDALYRVSALDPSASTGNNRFVANDTAVDTVTFVDVLADTAIVNREPLYTNGGITSNDPAPCAGGVIAGGKNRLFWTDPTDPHLVRFSQEPEGGFAVDAPARLAIACDPSGGPITGLAVMDDVVIVFKESAIFAIGGPGPLANPDLNPAQFSFTPPGFVTSDAGALRQASIAVTPVGVVFQSGKGIYLLDRARQLRRVGAPVDAYDDVPVTRARAMPDRSAILFLTAGDRSLYWDYEHDQWSTFTGHAGTDAIVVDGAYHYMRSDGRVFQETPGVYRDDNSNIVLVLETAWIKLAGYLQGWQWIWWVKLLGTYKSAHTLRVWLQLDYEDGWGSPFDIPVDADYDPALYGEGVYGSGVYGGAPLGANSTVYQQEIHVGERSQSFRMRIQDVEATGQFGASFELSELLVEGGILAPSFALPETRRS